MIESQRVRRRRRRGSDSLVATANATERAAHEAPVESPFQANHPDLLRFLRIRRHDEGEANEGAQEAYLTLLQVSAFVPGLEFLDDSRFA